MRTLGDLAGKSPNNAFAASLAAAVFVTLMSVLQLPVSASQAMVGAIIGVGLLHGRPRPFRMGSRKLIATRHAVT
jgi:phosphate/sulfate permease